MTKPISVILDDRIREFVPKWRVISKKDSLFHRAIGAVFSKYRTDYWTTIGFTAAHPLGRELSWIPRPHEGLHGLQAKTWTRPLFGFLYLFPQALAPLFAVLALCLSPWWLLGLVCLGPLPAPFRAYWEFKAYELSVMIYAYSFGLERTDRYIEKILDNAFFGWDYYKMFPLFRGWWRKKFQAARDRGDDGPPFNTDTFNGAMLQVVGEEL